MTRRWFNRDNRTGVAVMGSEWVDDAPAVSQAERPRLSHSETIERKIDTALDEGERNRRILLEDERRWRVAYTEVEQRALVLRELAGLDEDQQVEELRKLASLIELALGRAAIMKARRRDGTGLYRSMTGRDLPPFEGFGQAPACDDAWHQKAPAVKTVTCPSCKRADLP